VPYQGFSTQKRKVESANEISANSYNSWKALETNFTNFRIPHSALRIEMVSKPAVAKRHNYGAAKIPGPMTSKIRKEKSMNDTFLPAIEKPAGLLLKLAYYFTRRQFGKVLTPLKVHSARLPPGFGLFYAKIGKLDKKLRLPPEMVLLVREQVARLNVCLFCMDIGRSFTIKASMNQAKFDALEQYATSSLFTEAERAALDYVTELTRDKKVNPDTFARLARHYSEREICEIVWLVASEHLYNFTNLGLNIHSDMLCDISRKPK
jgi:alkylhydroperoxidase family enzyme